MQLKNNSQKKIQIGRDTIDPLQKEFDIARKAELIEQDIQRILDQALLRSTRSYNTLFLD
jgi:hypothetical protein